MIKLIKDNNITYGKIIRANYLAKDVEFFTQETDEIQFGVINFQKDYKTGAHYHNKSTKKTTQTDEILMIQTGSARVDFYNNKGEYIKSCEVFQGDIVIFNKGGHNILFYENTKVFIIKKGGYDKENDKTRIIGTNNLELLIEN